MISVLCATWLSFNSTKKYNSIELLSVHQEILSAFSLALAPRRRLPVSRPSAPSSSSSNTTSGNLRKTGCSALMGAVKSPLLQNSIKWRAPGTSSCCRLQFSQQLIKSVPSPCWSQWPLVTVGCWSQLAASWLGNCPAASRWCLQTVATDDLTSCLVPSITSQQHWA